jgi:hypothetical protein
MRPEDQCEADHDQAAPYGDHGNEGDRSRQGEQCVVAASEPVHHAPDSSDEPLAHRPAAVGVKKGVEDVPQSNEHHQRSRHGAQNRHHRSLFGKHALTWAAAGGFK